MNSEQEFFWLVGWLEGEGCFSLSRNSPLVHIGMTDKDTMEKVAELLGSHVYTASPHPQGNRKILYVVRIYGENAIVLMKVVMVYMSERRQKQIQKVLSVRKNAPGRSKLVAKQVIEIRKQGNKILQKELGNQYGVHPSVISEILSGKAWAHV